MIHEEGDWIVSFNRDLSEHPGENRYDLQIQIGVKNEPGLTPEIVLDRAVGLMAYCGISPEHYKMVWKPMQLEAHQECEC